MDGLWTTVVPGTGVAGVLLVVIGLLLRANLADRAQYVELQTKSGADYEEDIAILRRRIRELESLLDACREKRHEESMEAHRTRRGLEDELYECRREILRLQEQLGGVG